MMHAMKHFTVNVPTEDILALLKENKKHHADNYRRLEEVFRKKAIKAMEKNLEAAKRGEKVKLYVSLQMPKSYEKAYDEAIGLLEMSVDDTIELTGQLYQGWILDQWEWTEEFGTFMREGELPDSKMFNDFTQQ